MTEDQKKACAELADTCELRSEEEIARYISAIAHLREMPSREVLRQLLVCLRDRDAGEVQYELVEACEAYPRDLYVQLFLDEASTVLAKAPSWFDLMFQSILNSDGYREAAVRSLKMMPSEDRAFFREVIRRISTHTPKYGALLGELA